MSTGFLKYSRFPLLKWLFLKWLKWLRKPRTGVDWFLAFLRLLLLGVTMLGLLLFTVQQIYPDNFITRWVNPDHADLTGSQFKGLLVSGLTQGAMYGLIALGYSMVYGVLGFINFAHGEVFMAGAMTGMIASNKLDDAGIWESNFLGSLAFVLIVAVATSTLTAIAMEKIAYRPLRNSPRLILLITSVGMSFFIQNASLVLLGAKSKSYPRAAEWLNSNVGFIDVKGSRLLVIVVAGLSAVVLWWLVERTKTGMAMRAVAEDAEIAALMGIKVNRTIVTVFAVGGAMAGVAGILWGLLFRSVTHSTGFLPGIKAFSAAVLGGIGHLGGAMTGGLIIGVAESVGPIVFFEPLGVQGEYQLRDAVAFLVLVGVLLIRPSGLFGERLPAEDRV